MTEYETLTRKVEDLQVELYKAQQEQQKLLEEMTDVLESIDLGKNLKASVVIDYKLGEEGIFVFGDEHYDQYITLTTEQLNRAVAFLAQFNIPINRYNEYLESSKEETVEETTEE